MLHIDEAGLGDHQMDGNEKSSSGIYKSINRLLVAAMTTLLSANCTALVDCKRPHFEADKIICADPDLVMLDKELDRELKKILKEPHIPKKGVTRHFDAWWKYERPYGQAWAQTNPKKEDLVNNYTIEIKHLKSARDFSWKPEYAFFKDEDMVYEKSPVCREILSALNEHKYVSPFTWEGLPLERMEPDFQRVKWRIATPEEYSRLVCEKGCEQGGYWTYYVMLNKPGLWSGDTEQLKRVDKLQRTKLIRGAGSSVVLSGADIFIFRGDYYSYEWVFGSSPWLQLWKLDERGELVKPEGFAAQGEPWCQIAPARN